MASTTPSEGRRAPAPHQSALTLLTVVYTIGLVGTASLLVSRAFRTDWQRRWAEWTRPPVHHPAGYVAPRLPGRLPPLPPAPVMRSGPRVIVWHTPAPAHTIRRESRAVASLPPAAAPVPAHRLTRPSLHRAHSMRIAQRTMPVRTWQRPSGSSRSLTIIAAPTDTPSLAWAHPPDPTLPPECRPRNPVVVGQD